MPAKKQPTPQDAVTASQILLGGLARDVGEFELLDQARRGHLPVAGRSRHQSGDRAGVLLGFPLSPGLPGPGSMFATNCDRLEIFAGGRHLTTATPDRQRFGHLAYPPAFADLTMHSGTLPDLRVDGYTGTRLAAVLLMSADTSRDQLRLTADDTTITADGSDATRVTFRATDAHGNHRPHMTGALTLTLTGGRPDRPEPVRVRQLRRRRRRVRAVRPRQDRPGNRHRAARHAGQRVRASHRRRCLSGQISLTGFRGAEFRVRVEGSAPRRTFSRRSHGVVN